MANFDLPELGSFDHYARLVRRLLDVPVGLVSLVEETRQVFPGSSGLDGPFERETPLSHSFCQYVVKDQRPLIISDARQDPRLADNLAIEELHVIAYAGWPLVDHRGETIGSLCAIDSTPREWSREEIETLEDLASACSVELGERFRAQETAAALQEAEELGERSRLLLALSNSLSFTETLADVADAVAVTSASELGCERAGMWLHAPDADEQGAVTFVGNPKVTWRSAALFSVLPVDASTPLGEALRDRTPHYYRTRVEQNTRYPELVVPDQLGDARAFIPLVAGGIAYGVLALVWPGPRRFTVEDRTTIAALASYTAQAVQRAQLFQERIDVSLTLQSAMLTSLPQPDHLDLAARYLPAAVREQVGGDWYDAVVMPSGATHLMIGDVEGHNIEAAATMGQLRSMLRMAAWMSQDAPAANVESLDRAMRDLGVDTTASVVLARIEQVAADASTGMRRLRWANAGHLPPLLAERDGTVRLLEQPQADSILGVWPSQQRHDHDVAIHPESILLLYTDGLVERRGESLDVSLDRLCDAARTGTHLGAEAFLDHVLGELAIGTRHDDIAVLAVRFGAEL